MKNKLLEAQLRMAAYITLRSRGQPHAMRWVENIPKFELTKMRRYWWARHHLLQLLPTEMVDWLHLTNNLGPSDQRHYEEVR